MTATLLSARHLVKTFGDFRAVKDVSFDVARGETVALIGPNGAGKTTCFNMLTGQLPSTSGEIFLNGANVTGLPPRAMNARGVGRTFQISTAFSSLSVLENAQVAMLAHRKQALRFLHWPGARDHQTAMALLTLVGLQAQHDRPCSELAYGDVKRLELAMALASSPTLLLMDEPTAGMAPSERQALMQLVSDIVDQRAMAVLFTEHDMDAVFTHADRILVLDRGRLVAHGTPAQVRADAHVQEIYLGSGATFHAS